jgi:hypothetical protein
VHEPVLFGGCVEVCTLILMHTRFDHRGVCCTGDTRIGLRFGTLGKTHVDSRACAHASKPPSDRTRTDEYSPWFAQAVKSRRPACAENRPRIPEKPYVYSYIYVCIRVRIYTYPYLYIYICICMYLCVYVYIYIYIYIYMGIIYMCVYR